MEKHIPIKQKTNLISPNKLLIEELFPTKQISEKGAQERYKRKGHINAIKTWWARRPLVTARAIIFASLVKNDLIKLQQLLLKLIDKINPDDQNIRAAKKAIQLSNKKSLKLLDPFGGGGSIVYEAARLGLSSTVVELNPIAHILEKAVLEYPQQFRNIADKLNSWGKKIIDRSKADLLDEYPPISTNTSTKPIVYFWTRKIKCYHCNQITPVVKNNYLIKKPNKHLHITYSTESANSTGSSWKIEEKTEIHKLPRGSIQCKICQNLIYTRKLQAKPVEYELQAVCSLSSNHTGKKYYAASDLVHPIPDESQIQAKISLLHKHIGRQIPRVKLKPWSGIINPTVYGYAEVDQLFSPRQILALLTLINNARKCYYEMIEEGMDKKEAKAIIVYISSLIEHLVDWNSTLTMWIAQNEQTGRSLAGPGLPMRWEFIEINPFGKGPSNLYEKLARIVTSLRSIPQFDHPVKVVLGDATNLPFDPEIFDIIISDPPYFDNIFYSALSDLFVPWFTLLFHGIDSVFSDLQFDSTREITSSKHLFGTHASKTYQQLITQALSEMHRVLHPEGKIILLYSHKTLDGWSTLADALVAASLQVSSVIPLQMERKARPRGMKTHALSSVIVLIIQKRNTSRKSIFHMDLLKKKQIKHFLLQSYSQKIYGSDLVVALASYLIQFYSTYNFTPVSGDNTITSYEQFYLDSLPSIRKIQDELLFSSMLWQDVQQYDVITQLFILYRKQYQTKTITSSQFNVLCQQIPLSEQKKNTVLNMKFPFELKNNQISCHQLGNELTVQTVMKDQWSSNSLIIMVNQLIIKSMSNHQVKQSLEKSNKYLIQLLVYLAGIKLPRRKESKLSDITFEQKKIRKLLNRIQ